MTRGLGCSTDLLVELWEMCPGGIRFIYDGGGPEGLTQKMVVVEQSEKATV